MHDKYPESASKQDKGVIQKCSKHYRARDGQLYRVHSSGNKQEERLCLVIKDLKTKRQAFEGCQWSQQETMKGETEHTRRIQ